MTEHDGEPKAAQSEPVDNEAAQPPVGTTGAESGRDAVETDLAEEVRLLKEERRLALEQWKPKAERVNELEREVADLRARVAYPSPTGPDPRVAQQQQAMDLLAQQIQEAEWDAQRGDRNAALLVASLRQQFNMQQQFQMQFQLQSIPEADRPKVLQRLETGRYADVQAAFESVEYERLKSEKETLKKREDELAEQIDARRRGVVGAGPSIPVSDRKLSGEVSGADFSAQHDRIFETQGPAAARAFAAKAVDLGNGKVRLG